MKQRLRLSLHIDLLSSLPRTFAWPALAIHIIIPVVIDLGTITGSRSMPSRAFSREILS